MTAFATPILDNFNRASENPLAGGWMNSTAFDTASFPTKLALSGNQCLRAAANSFSSQVWGTAYGDQEVYATIPVVVGQLASSWNLLARITNPGTTAMRCYLAKLGKNAADAFSTFQLLRMNGSISVEVDFWPPATLLFPFAAGDAFGLRVFDVAAGVRLEVWARNSGTWQRFFAATDSTPGRVTSSGYPGLFIQQAGSATGLLFDDFGGGTFTPPTNTLGEAYPTLTGALPDPLGVDVRQVVPLPLRAAVPDPLAEKVWSWKELEGEGTVDRIVEGGGISIYS